MHQKTEEQAVRLTAGRCGVPGGTLEPTVRRSTLYAGQAKCKNVGLRGESGLCEH